MAESLKKGIGVKFLLPIVALYAAAAGLLGLDGISLTQALIHRAGAAGASGVGLLVLEDLLPRSVKEAIVFWRVRDRLPGFRAFTVVALGDGRIDRTILAGMLPATPMTPAEQNVLWYRWLKSVEDDPAVTDAHRRFLALRECAVLLLMLGILSPMLLVFPGQSIRGVVSLAAGCAAAFLPASLAARNAATRLVTNVIARKIAVG